MDMQNWVNIFLKVGVAMETPRFIVENVNLVITENWRFVNQRFWIKPNIQLDFKFLIEPVFSL